MSIRNEATEVYMVAHLYDSHVRGMLVKSAVGRPTGMHYMWGGFIVKQC